MNILGISAYYHDSAASLLRDGEIIAAAQEERFSRKKHDARFRKRAAEYCLAEGKVALQEIDYVIFDDKLLVKFDRRKRKKGIAVGHLLIRSISFRRPPMN
jgi:carbamoyltransferase